MLPRWKSSQEVEELQNVISEFIEKLIALEKELVKWIGEGSVSM